MTLDELKTVLEGHKLWLQSDPAGKRAYLQGAYLQGAYLRGADLRGAYLRGADLQGADLRGADLQGADLQGAYLQGAYLQGAYLRGADLRGADLQGAYLRGADLRGAKGCNKNRTTDLYILMDQPGKIRAYKLVDEKGYGPYRHEIEYRKGQTYEAAIDADENEHCGAGINLATLPWCMAEWRPGYRILIAEFTIEDPATDICIPIATDGKFRVRKCKIVGEKDLVELGLEEPKP